MIHFPNNTKLLNGERDPLRNLRLGETILHRGQIYMITDGHGMDDSTSGTPAVNLRTGALHLLESESEDYRLLNVSVDFVSIKQEST